MKVSVFGLGYVGLANALLLSQEEEVIAYVTELFNREADKIDETYK